jgi:hypothetical protein
MSSNKVCVRGPGLLGLLGLLLIGLKLAGVGEVATWSWWLVLAPWWGPPGLVLALAVAGGIVWAVAAVAGVIGRALAWRWHYRALLGSK